MKDTRTGAGAPLTSPDRLAALDETGLMDSPVEEVFDRAVRLATRLLGTRVGLLSLVDGRRQFFKAQTGLPEPFATTRETPLSHSFCQYVVGRQAPLVIRDARKDETLGTNPAIPEMGVIAYLGVPVRSPGGEVLGSVCAIEPIPRDWTDEEQAVLADIAAMIESEIRLRTLLRQRDAESATLRTLHDRLNLALKSGGLGTYDLDLHSGRASWDAELYQLWDIPTHDDDPFEKAVSKIHPDDRAAHEAAFAEATDPSGPGRYAAELRVMLDGPETVRWVSSTGLVRFDDGKPARMVGTVKDISDRKKAEDHSLMLTQELNHRVKNLFAITNGLVAITARESRTIPEMQEALRARIVSLSAAHDLVRPAITKEHYKDSRTDLAILARTILEPHRRAGADMALTGPPVALDPQAASSLALVLHELATNAGKYGALSAETGHVDLEWELSEGMLNMVWREHGGPPVDAAKAEQGFGSTLIDLTIRRQMQGSYAMDWATEGLICTLRIPWDDHSAAG